MTHLLLSLDILNIFFILSLRLFLNYSNPVHLLLRYKSKTGTEQNDRYDIYGIKLNLKAPFLLRL